MAKRGGKPKARGAKRRIKKAATRTKKPRAKPTKAKATKPKRKPAPKPKPTPRKRKPAPKPKPTPRKRKPAAATKPKRKLGKPPRSPPPRTDIPLDAQLVDALEMAQDIATSLGHPTSLDIQRAPTSQRSRTPWLVVGRFVFEEPPTYAELWDILSAWETDDELESAIHPQRLSRIRVDYQPKRGKGGEYTIGETGPWELVISRSRFQMDASDEDSLASRYSRTVVTSLYVWLSSQLANDRTVTL